MNNEKLREDLKYLVEKYISDDCLRLQLLKEVFEDKELGVKGILYEVTESKEPFDDTDTQMLKDIVFYFV